MGGKKVSADWWGTGDIIEVADKERGRGRKGRKGQRKARQPFVRLAGCGVAAARGLEYLVAEGHELRGDLESVLGDVALVDLELELASVGDEGDAGPLGALAFGARDDENLVAGLRGDEGAYLL